MKQLLAILILIVTLTGCTTVPSEPKTPEQQQAATLDEIQFWSYMAANLGTSYALVSNPEYRPAFERAVGALTALTNSTNGIDPLAFRLVLQQLPVKELRSTEARLAITTATILFQRYGKNVVIDQGQYVSTAATAVRNGINDALAAEIQK